MNLPARHAKCADYEDEFAYFQEILSDGKSLVHFNISPVVLLLPKESLSSASPQRAYNYDVAGMLMVGSINQSPKALLY